MLKKSPYSERNLIEELKMEIDMECENILQDAVYSSLELIPILTRENFLRIATSCPYTYQEICTKWKLYEDEYYHMYEYISDYKVENVKQSKMLEEAYSTIVEENNASNPPVLFVIVISKMIKTLIIEELLNPTLSIRGLKKIQKQLREKDLKIAR